MAKRSLGCLALIAGGAFALTIALPPLAGAVDSTSPVRDPPAQQSTQSGKPAKATKKRTKKEKKSEQQFINGYKAAHATIYKRHDYARGIDMLKALGHDDNPDVANLIGYSSRKLGRYEDSKTWYERALAADPSHSRTWSYYGMWHAEQGNLLKAREHLAKVASLCGTKCRDYTELKGVIEGTRTY
ncbi:MAG: tetratricopeptide repeat protein [Xanthobacteraceae bacterium]|nr:tetratricopeptide repeat protein [Xanthobacteraceae bacterium]